MTHAEAEPALIALEHEVREALRTGEVSNLSILGYGEISAVLAFDGADGASVAKRLPRFPSQAAFEAYAALFAEYLDTLRTAGVHVLDSKLSAIPNLEHRDGGVIAYCVQPCLAPESLLVEGLRSASEVDAKEILRTLTETIRGAVSRRVGLDGQCSNWVMKQGTIRYLDVTTPLLRDAAGRERLDTELFLASLPWALRPAVRAFLLRSILDKYYEPRGVILDLAGNLLKEGLERQLVWALEVSNGLATDEERGPITPEEARAYYQDDARTWALLQRLRRVDRAWQRKVRRRSYPFLLPGAIERYV